LISLSEKLVFEPGTVEIPEDVYPVLDTIAEMIRPINNKVRLVGHTDDTPSTDPRYATNLELSVARSVAVANYLINSGIDSDRLVVSGRGSAEPVFDDEGSELKRLNSRVEIVIIYNVEENVVGVGNVGINP
jgi:chemotaxis protein MotB